MGDSDCYGNAGAIQDALVPLLSGTKVFPASPKTDFKGGGVTVAGPG